MILQHHRMQFSDDNLLAHREHESVGPGHVDAVQRHLALLVVGQVSFPGKGVRSVGLTRIGVLGALENGMIESCMNAQMSNLNASREVECYFNGPRPLIAWQPDVRSDHMEDDTSGGHVAHLGPVHLLAVGTLDVGLGRGADHLLETRPVVGVATVLE